MRELPLCLLLLFLQGSSPSWSGEATACITAGRNSWNYQSLSQTRRDYRCQSGLPPKSGLEDRQPSTDATWSQGLTLGVNGPIPVIVVDQFGYLPDAVKVAVIRDPQVGYDKEAHVTPGTRYAVVERTTGRIAKEAAPTAWNGGATDAVSGDKAWWFDFSDVTAPGIYTVVDIDKGVRSVEFEIGDRIYRNVLKHAVRTYFYQRAGFEKRPETAGSDWADAASHLGAGQDPQTHPWRARGPSWTRMGDSQTRDLRGGWFDAGDYNKYTNWAARNVIVLLRAYAENPHAFGDDSGIAESGNGVPDILDEVKWALDWLVRMQNADGSLLCVQGLDNASPPSAAKGPSYYGPATTAASLMGAAAFAYASKIYAARAEADLKLYAADLARRAEGAWDWATANPSTRYYNNDEAKQPGSSGLAAGQQEMSDAERLFAKIEAAVYLYDLTGGARYKDFVEANYTSIISDGGPTQWEADKQDALLYYTGSPRISPAVKAAILNKFVTNVTMNADQLPMIIKQSDPYRSPIKEYTWGSNQSKLLQARLYQLLASYGNGDRMASIANSAALDYLHYIHGVNPLGLVYLTNMKLAGAESSVSTMFHNWFAHGSKRWERVTGTTPGPPPGYLVGGPNPHFSVDECCSAKTGSPAYRCYGSAAFVFCGNNYAPPRGQPALKSYLQFNEGWPANSWEVTEPSTGYQASYIRVLAAYAR